MNKKVLWGIVAVVVLILIIAVSTNKKTVTNDTGDIKLGAILILSGDGAAWGEASRNGIDLAVSEINNSGGIDSRKIVVTYEDDAASPQKSISAFNKLVKSDGVRFIIGTNWSVSGTPLINLADQDKVVLISPSLGVKAFNEGSKYIFNTWPHDYILSRNLAEYAYNKGARNVALLGAQDVWVKDQTANFKERFEQLGGKVSIVYEPLTTETDVRTTVLKIRNDKSIDSVILTTDGYSLTGIFAKQIKQLSVNLPIYAITVDQQNLDNCLGACDGMTMLTFLTPTKSFSDKYTAKYNRQVEIGSDSAYDAVIMLAKAIKETKSTDADKVAEYLASIKNYSGASGSLVSDGKRAFTKPFIVNKIVNGKPVLIGD
ncbi:MAG: ABC transporter substrate-binding protein [Candidatus Taylorbacteria bacterium]|nr:ABC transporter substrate-binding protein [Candidatus Taylorbacteria bacterium]